MHLTSDFILLTSDLIHQTSDFILLTSDLRPHTSDFQPHTSDFILQTFRLLLLISVKPCSHPTSYINKFINFGSIISILNYEL